MKSDSIKLIIGLGLTLLVGVQASAQLSSPIYTSQISGDIKIDGYINEAQWVTIEPLQMVSHWPESGNKGMTNSEIRIGYNKEYLYVSAKCFNSKENIQGPTYKRDALGMNMDHVALILDTYNDNENALIFVVTPTGSRADLTVISDASTGDINSTWDSFWDAEVTQDDQGWYAEMRIPFTSLKFQSVQDEITMGMTVYSYQANGIIMDTWPEIPKSWGFWSFAKPSQTQKVIFKNIVNEKPIYIAPYVLTGIEQNYIINNEETDYTIEKEGEFEAGLDVKYSVSDNLSLDVTVNTDFAQVEADDAQINLSRFSLFFPEKRKFFLERASNFDFNFGGFNQLFYSRRIGIYEDEQVRILGGARLVGRAGKWDVGLLNLQTGRKGDIPSENFGVYRFRRQVFNSYSYLGAIITSRIAENGYYNLAYGVDGILRVFGDDYMSYNLAQTIDEELDNSIGGAEATRANVTWERRKFDGISYQTDVNYGGVDYKPGIGFEERNDFSQIGGILGYGWLPGEKSNISRFQLSISGSSYYRNSDNSLESLEYGPGWSLNTKNGVGFNGGISGIKESLRDTFNLSDDAYIPTGEYTFANLNLYYESPQGKLLRVYGQANMGSFYDGTRFSAEAGPSWSINKHLELSGFYQYNIVKFAPRDQEFLAHIARFKVLYSFNTKLEASSYIQYNSASKTSVINFRMRYNPKDGNDFYLVFNEGDDINRNTYDFNPPTVEYRAILLKYIYTFIF